MAKRPKPIHAWRHGVVYHGRITMCQIFGAEVRYAKKQHSYRGVTCKRCKAHKARYE